MSFTLPGWSMDQVWDKHNQSQLDIRGKLVTYTPSGGAARAIKAIVYPGARDEGVEPGNSVRAFVHLSDLNGHNPANGDLVQVDSTSYVVEDVGEHLNGSATLRLRRRSV